MRVVTVVGTRPEIIKLSRVMSLLDETDEHIVVHTGQNYDRQLNQVFFEELDLRPPDHQLDCAGPTAFSTIGAVLVQTDELFRRLRPDAVLILGDTNSAMCAMSAKRNRIPVFHMEAGNRSFDDRVPEEINRRVVDHLSDVNMPYTEHARRYLLREGLAPDRVIKTGSPQKEVLTHYADRIAASDVLERLGLESGGYLAASIHREENVDEPHRLRLLMECLGAVADDTGRPIVLSVHPRTRARMDEHGIAVPDAVRAMPPLGLPDYVRLQSESHCTVSDSGTITEESSILGFPAITIREAHERPEGMDVGAVVMSGLHPGDAVAAVRLARLKAERGLGRVTPPDYDVDDVSIRVVNVIHSYVDFVNRRVWSRPPV